MTVLPLALGAMNFGTRIDEPTSFALLDRFVDAGGGWIDTADCYSFWNDPSGHGGQSEELLGRWLAARPGVREKVLLATKTGAEPVEPGSFPGRTTGLSPSAVRDSLHGSLRRLGVDAVDLFWAHKEDRDVPVEDSAVAFGELVRDGLTGRVGVSNHPAWRVERARRAAADAEVAPFSAIQLRKSYLSSRPDITVPGEDHRFGALSDEQLDHAAAHGMDIWAYTPLLRGWFDRTDRILAEPFRHPGTERRMDALTEVAVELGVTRGQVVLAWLIGGTPSIVPILGGSSVAQLDAALVGARLELPAELRARLDAAA
ncbi:aldo/keto reductase [Nakamurella sp. YIM 132087]|uniref:Aldo/keto reductase n=1 Tax=Nakamurella alba TaxID=2665158 RepID=A0A7K1FEZ1_9ACTN|nr:aldo/keto reductase [Nakamurella alba]MTD12650.1 aldo/keto reductase [Nakamurella alba]